jgi:hypothetical protein
MKDKDQIRLEEDESGEFTQDFFKGVKNKMPPISKFSHKALDINVDSFKGQG